MEEKKRAVVLTQRPDFVISYVARISVEASRRTTVEEALSAVEGAGKKLNS